MEPWLPPGRSSCPGAYRSLILAGALLLTGPWEATAGVFSARGSQLSEEVPLTPPVPDSLRLRLEVPPEVKAGTGVPITVGVENLTGRRLDLYLTGRPIAFDLIVTDQSGGVVWRRLEGHHVPMVLRIETLEPGACLEFGDTWNQRTTAGNAVPPGLYRVRGEILSENGPLVTPIRTVEIIP